MKKIITNKTFSYMSSALKSLIFLLVFYVIGPQNLAWAQGEFVLHVIAPQATDPAIDRALDDHLTWIDQRVRSNRSAPEPGEFHHRLHLAVVQHPLQRVRRATQPAHGTGTIDLPPGIVATRDVRRF